MVGAEMDVRRVLTVMMYLIMGGRVVGVRELVEALGSKGQDDVRKQKQQQ